MVGCLGCDLLVELPSLVEGETGFCPRCGHVLQRKRKDTVNRTLIVSITGLIFYGPAIFTPILTLDTMGLWQQGTIAEGVTRFYEGGYPLVAVAVLLTSVLLPLAKHLLLFFVSCSLKLGRVNPAVSYSMRLYQHLKEWGMDEVYLIGVMVTLIKVKDMADITYEIGFWAFLGLVGATVGLSITCDVRQFWREIERGSR